MARICTFTGKRPTIANKVSHSNIKTKRRQLPNLQWKKLWWEEAGRFVHVRLSVKALRTVSKLGLQAYAEKVGVDLNAY